ncbi:hypothetical protein BOX15_Mlig020460g2 [Macrostomum lignano]|uniref:Cytochrome P450 n=1 Tax=Macrostomum lignano TaxID=282301 RepID=A0A267EGU0_9PLAT|nr:hypothetical protein BOX15_Mlig020460g2 [Macrostomum lignano]
MTHLLSSLDLQTSSLGVGVPVALFGCYLASRWFRNRSLPPGPVALPVIGRLPWMDQKQAHLCVIEMCKQYGDLISYRMGSQLMVAVNSYDLLKEIMEDENYTGRPRLPFLDRVTQGCGIFFTEGESWSQQRRLAMRSLRDFGFARTRSAEMVDAQVDIIFQLLEAAADNGDHIRTLEAFTEATNGVIAQLTLGRRYERGEKEFIYLNETIKAFFNTSFLLSMPLLFPSLDVIVRTLPASSSFNNLVFGLQDFVRNQVNQRKEIVDDSMEPECLCDVYIQERRRCEKRGDYETFKEHQIVRGVVEFFVAGTDTTARSLEWLVVLMAVFPAIQDKLHEELIRVVGSERRPLTSDKSELNYTLAVIEESFRFVSLVAIGVMHRAKQDAIFHGYRIPKDSIILPCTYGINHDSRIWAKPDEFYPEHFLNEKGAYTGHGKNVPFMIGRRACPGEGLARMEVLLVFSAIMQRFRVTLAPEYVGKEAEILKGSYGILRQPGDYKLSVQKR